jgi:flagellar FliJ protein
MKYRYPLQKILDLKEKEKEMLQVSLSSSLNKLEKEKENYQRLQENINSLEHDWAMNQQRILSIADWAEWYSYKQLMEKKLNEKAIHLQRVEQEVERKREQVLEKAREVKIYQILKARDYTRYLATENRKEQIVLDEISANSYIRANTSK